MCVCGGVFVGVIYYEKGREIFIEKEFGRRLSTSQHAAAQASVQAGLSMTPTAPLQMMGGILYMSFVCIKLGDVLLRRSYK